MSAAVDGGTNIINDCINVIVRFSGNGDQAVFNELNADFSRCIAEDDAYTCSAGASSFEQCENEIIPRLQERIDELAPDLGAEASCINICNE